MKKLKRQHCIDQFPALPHYVGEELIYQKEAGSYVCTLEAASIRSHIKTIIKEFLLLKKRMNLSSLIFLGETATPWLLQPNDYKPVKAALDYLQEAGVGKIFDGGLLPVDDELPDFLLHFFWLRRCNVELPILNFTDSDQQIRATICKQGNLHIDAMNKIGKKELEKCISNSAFRLIEWHQCYNQYYKTSAIPGRRIMM